MFYFYNGDTYHRTWEGTGREGEGDRERVRLDSKHPCLLSNLPPCLLFEFRTLFCTSTYLGYSNILISFFNFTFIFVASKIKASPKTLKSCVSQNKICCFERRTCFYVKFIMYCIIYKVSHNDFSALF